MCFTKKNSNKKIQIKKTSKMKINLNFLIIFILNSFNLIFSSQIHYYNLIISKVPLKPDGYNVLTYTINGQLPGPIIKININDRLLINVTNDMFMHESITMHWHGINQKNSQWYDGTGFITSCPITYGSSFLYNFTVTRPGTFWYHAHTGETRIKGTYGLLIVLDNENNNYLPYKYDEEKYLMIGDWYHTATTDLDSGLMSKPFVWTGNGNSVLFNGKGECKECNTTGSYYTTTTEYSDKRWSKTTTKIQCQGSREKFYVHSGKTYLVRFVNVGSLAYYNFAIAGHTMLLVGADGHAIQMKELNSIDIGPGCRIEVLIKADKQPAYPVGSTDTYSYLMKAQTDWRGVDNTPSGIGWGYWVYVAPDKTTGTISTISSITPPNESREWNVWNSLLVANTSVSTYRKSPSNDKVTKKFVFTLQQEYVNKITGLAYNPPIGTPTSSSLITSDMVLAWTMNGVRLNMPTTPYLLERYLDKIEGKTFEDDGSSTFRLEMNDIVDVTIQNSVAGNGICEQHPWHLHGYDFWLVGQGSDKFSSSTSESGYNIINPPLLDSVTGYPSNHSNRRGATTHPGTWLSPCGWITFRFEVTNPGMWLLHCHVAWHATMGMAVVFDAASELVGKYPDDMELCGSAPERVAAIANSNNDNNNNKKNNDSESSNDNLNTGQKLTIAIIVTFFCTVVMSWFAFYFMYGIGGGDEEMTKMVHEI